jgi:hypothetical protein
VRLLDIGRRILLGCFFQDEKFVKTAHRSERPGGRPGLQLSSIQKPQELRDVRGLDLKEIRGLQMRFIHLKIVPVRSDRVLRDTFFESQVLKKSIDPLPVSHLSA